MVNAQEENFFVNKRFENYISNHSVNHPQVILDQLNKYDVNQVKQWNDGSPSSSRGALCLPPSLLCPPFSVFCLLFTSPFAIQQIDKSLVPLAGTKIPSLTFLILN
ncbi:MAG: hypothetical protein AB9882_08515 [Ignavibacteriaceae bacterium]